MKNNFTSRNYNQDKTKRRSDYWEYQMEDDQFPEDYEDDLSSWYKTPKQA